jgi:DNA-binding response OmpR family regulator
MTGSTIGVKTMAFFKETGRPYLLKPFTPDELKAIVSQTLRSVEIGFNQALNLNSSLCFQVLKERLDVLSSAFLPKSAKRDSSPSPWEGSE